MESVLKLTSSGKSAPMFAMLSLQGMYYFYYLYQPFSYLYFGGALTVGLWSSLSALGSSLMRTTNVASITMLSHNRVRILMSDGSQKDMAISDIKKESYFDSKRPLVGHVVKLTMLNKKAQICFNSDTTFSPDILYALVHQDVHSIIDPKTA